MTRMTETIQWSNSAGIGVSPVLALGAWPGIGGRNVEKMLYCWLQNLEYGSTPSFAISCFTIPVFKLQADYLWNGEVQYLSHSQR